MKILSHNGDGPTFDLIERNGLLYTTQGTNVYIYDVSANEKLANLTWQNYVGKIDANQFIRIIKIKQNHLFILTSGNLQIYDLTSPSTPTHVSTYTHTERIFEHKGLSITEDGNFAYISSYDVGIIAVDISNKSTPVYTNTLILTDALESNRPWRSTIYGNTLYVGTELLDGKVYKIDITTRSNPTIIMSWASPNAAERVGISSVAVSNDGKHLLAIEYHNGVWILDTATMMSVGSPVEIGEHNYSDIIIIGYTAYISVRYGGYDTYDLISLPNKTLIQSVSPDVPGYTEGIFVTPEQLRVYIAVNTMGFIAYNNSNKFVPVELVKVPVVGGLISLAKKGNYLYGGCQNEGVWVYDVSNPLNPVKVEFTFNSGRNEQIAIQGNKLYVAGDWAQLSVYDITDPTTFVTDTYRYGPAISNILVDGKYAYVSEYQIGKLGVYDISDPKSVKIISESQFNFAGKMIKSNNYLIGAGAYGTNLGLHIIDVSNVNSPILLKTWMGGFKIDDVKINGDILYVLSVNDIYTVKLSDILLETTGDTPYAGHLSWSGEWYGKALSLDSVNNLLHAIGSTFGSVRTVDVRDPHNITEIVHEPKINMPEIGYDILYSDGLLYVADYYSGLYIIDAENTGENGSLDVTTVTFKATLQIQGEIRINGTIFGSGHIFVDLPPGNYLVEFGDVPNYTTPQPIMAAVIDRSTTYITGSYIDKPPPVEYARQSRAPSFLLPIAAVATLAITYIILKKKK